MVISTPWSSLCQRPSRCSEQAYHLGSGHASGAASAVYVATDATNHRGAARLAAPHRISQMTSDSSNPPYETNLSWPEFEQVIEELEHDPPRSAVLLGHALLENIMKRILLSRMIALSSDDIDRLFTGAAPLATMSARIRLTYAFGLISKKARRDLETASKIRNRFAHSGRTIAFEDEEIVKLCQKLSDWDDSDNATGDPREQYIDLHCILATG